MEPLQARLARLKILFLDCDGVLTDGGIYYDNEGAHHLRFDVKDGMGIALLSNSGLKISVVSGRNTAVAEQRFARMKLHSFHGGIANKDELVSDVCTKEGIDLSQTAFVGDDLNDLKAFAVVGTRIAVRNAVPEVAAAAHWVTKNQGGAGAIREIAEEIGRAKGWYDDWIRRFSA